MSFRATVMLLLSLSMACGEEGSASAPGEIPADKQLNALSAGELKQVCERSRGKFGQLASFMSDLLCTVDGLARGQGEPCVMVRDQCLATPREQDLGDEPFDCTRPPEEVIRDCTATVSQFEACVDATLRGTQSFFAEFTCNSDLAVFEQSVPEPEECKLLSDACGLRD